jgi:selenocysteine lyase/cysteine desulfurase
MGSLRYLEGLGDSSLPTRKRRLAAAMHTIREHEQALSRALLDGLESIRGVRVWGITDRQRLHERVPTVSFTLEGRSPKQVAEKLASQGIQVWDGHYYALAIMERLNQLQSGGMVRVGAVHYNRLSEISRLVDAVSA